LKLIPTDLKLLRLEGKYWTRARNKTNTNTRSWTLAAQAEKFHCFEQVFGLANIYIERDIYVYMYIGTICVEKTYV